MPLYSIWPEGGKLEEMRELESSSVFAAAAEARAEDPTLADVKLMIVPSYHVNIIRRPWSLEM